MAAMNRQPTFGDMLANNPRPAGFDYIRLILAILVMVDHSFVACLGEPGQRAVFSSVLRPVFVSLVPMFFALSGFLVTGSLLRSPMIAGYAGLRVLRIFPALVVENVFTAFILGALLTTVPLHTYFTSPVFFKYLLNMVGYIHYELPGLFKGNPVPLVNVQLWTIPFELTCYLSLAGLAYVGFHKRPYRLLATAVITALVAGLWTLHSPLKALDTWHLLAPCFLFGVCCYLFRDRIPHSLWLALGAAAVAWALLTRFDGWSTLAALPLAYVVAYFGLTDPPRDPIVRSGDYSYPIYLYSFPIQQALLILTPWAATWWINFLLALPISLLLAAFSWHCVEKPFQKLRYVAAKFNWQLVNPMRLLGRGLEGGFRRI